MKNIKGECETQRVTLTVCTHTHAHTQKGPSLNKAGFWWVAMNALPHTSNLKLTEPTSRPSNQVPTLPVVTVLKLSTVLFFVFFAQETVVWSHSRKIETHSWCDFLFLNHSNRTLVHSMYLYRRALSFKGRATQHLPPVCTVACSFHQLKLTTATTDYICYPVSGQLKASKCQSEHSCSMIHFSTLYYSQYIPNTRHWLN